MKFREVDDKQKFLQAFEARTRQLTDRAQTSTLPKSHVAFEVIAMALSGYEGDLTADEIIQSLPIQSWRENTVVLPSTLISTLVDGWLRYRDAPSGSTLGECFQLEGGGQGSRPAKQKSDQIDQDVRLSNAVCLELTFAKQYGKNLSKSEAYRLVAEREQAAGPEVSEETIKRAFKKHGASTLRRIEELLKNRG